MSQDVQKNKFYSDYGPGKDLTVGQIISKGVDKKLSDKRIYELTNEEAAQLNKITNNKFDKTLRTLMNNQQEYNRNHNMSNPKELNYLQYEKALEKLGAKLSWAQYYETGKGSEKKVMNYTGHNALQQMGLVKLEKKKILI